MARLIIESGENKGQVYDLQEMSIIGRSSSNTISLNDAMASREHAKITREADGFYILDLGSRNSTLVNGEKIRTRKLTKYDLVTIGRTYLRFDDSEVPAKETEVSPKQTEEKVQSPPKSETKPETNIQAEEQPAIPKASPVAIGEPRPGEGGREEDKKDEEKPDEKKVYPEGPSILTRIIQIIFLLGFFAALLLLSKWVGELVIDRIMQEQSSTPASEKAESKK